ncbi:hypothetical protein GO755_38935 [Spirosoma sp. HMF4905]|uniref:Uncharacterized protein n=1 Tax=Spirosoma arboris TaxID=2682092 RepID=A0A7K1SQG6_9BACT|nr:hypothetical protein [Spirosoma arboris]MVM36054.1 hypothetical protein [Spirosoma arboris]
MKPEMESNGIMFEPKYRIRHLVYEDFTRERAFLRMIVWVDDRYIKKMPFGFSIESTLYGDNGELTTEYLTVANYPKKVEIEYPEGSGKFIEQVDICFAPTEQFMLYQHTPPEEINPNPIIINQGEDPQE